MKRGFNKTARYLSITGVFLSVMLLYIVLLAIIQINGAKNKVDDGVAYTRTVTVSGLRGEIYDRNGVLLVGNSTSYDIILEYGAIPDTTSELNRSILAALEAIREKGCEDKLCLDLYALEGTYPDLRYCEAVKYSNTREYDALVKILESNGLDTSSTSAEKLVKHFTKKYKLDTSLYSNEEITDLLRVRYAMERVKFGAYQPFTLAENINMELVSHIEEASIDGITLKINSERRYEYPGYASHILGRLGKIQAEDAEYYDSLGYPMDAYVGTSGCEKEFEEHLRGQDGTVEISYDADGNVISKTFIKEPISGNDVYLTIDIELQIAAENSLKETVDSLAYSDSGAVVALDPDSGEVLVIASYPTYDLTQFGSQDYYNGLLNDPANPLFDRALLGEYAPGSIYKIGSSLAALEEGEISASTTFNCEGTFPHLHRPTCLGVGGVNGKHGFINVINAIGVSCNCFFYEIGMRMGIDNINTYTSRLGLGVPTGIELPERTGTVAGSEYRQANGLTPWSQGDDLSAVIGQSDHTYSPLQLGVFMSSVVNGGDRYSAHLLHSVKKFYTGETIYQRQPKILDSVTISDSNYDTLVSGMRQVILSSSSLRSYFSSIDVLVGGKTGTAEVAGKKDYALFAGFAPLNSPEIVSVCVLEQGVNGGNAAIPISKIFEKYFEQEKAVG